MVIAIDVDLTLVDTLTPWISWYKHKTGHDLNHILEEQKEQGFRLHKLMNNHEDPLSYWKSPTLYDNLEPLEHTVEIISKWKETHEIIYVSHCFPEHIESKVAFLRRNFGPEIKFIDTKHKEYVAADIFIDDFYDNLQLIQERQPNCIILQKKTPLNGSTNHKYFDSWKELEFLI